MSDDSNDLPQPLPTTRITPRPHGEHAEDSRVAELVDGFFEALQRGEHPNADELISQHPDLADELRDCLDALQLMHPSGESTSQACELQEVGDFRILREVGRGGMGVVYEAQQISLNRRVALKILRHAIADRDAMQRFQREAETVANLQHSNIVPIFAVGEQDGQHYFAMQFIEGQSLADLQTKAETPLDPMDIADWGLQTAEALAYSHERDIIHRDVKPSNLIRDEQGKVWLTDFGLAKRLDDVQLSMTGAILGTPRYMSPEQASSMRRPVDHRTDIYSLGATLYELATGRPLFDADTPHRALGQIISDDPVAPRTIRPTLPRDLETIITRCISKQASDRYTNATDLVFDLRAFLDGRPIKARRPTALQLAQRWFRKNQLAVHVAATAAVVSMIAVLAGSYGIQHYRWSQLGRIQFSLTSQGDAPVVAEILDTNGKAAVPRFTVPSQQPVEIPRGDYKLLLRSSGDLSESFDFSVYPEPGNHSLKIHKHNHQAWDKVPAKGIWRLWNRPGGEDIVAFDGEGVSLLDGETSDEIWRVELESNQLLHDQLRAAQFNWAWVPHISHNSRYGQAQLCLDPAGKSVDVNADGVDDLLLALHYFPTVLALSGTDGELLWSSTVRPLPIANDTIVSEQTEDQRVPFPDAGAILHQPLLRDANGDGVTDLIAMAAVLDDNGDLAVCLTAISGADGSHLWEFDVAVPNQKVQGTTHPFAAQWYTYGPEDLSRSWHERWGDIITRDDNGTGAATGELVPYAAEMVSIDGRDELIFVVDHEYIGVDPQTGKEVRREQLGFLPSRPPIIFASDSGKPNLMLCEQLPNKGAEPQLRVSVRDLATRKLHWSQTVEANWRHCAPDTASPHDWPLLEDLDGDGIVEVILPEGSTMGEAHFEIMPAGGLQVLDSRTGERKWTDPDTAINAEFQLNRFVVVRDQNDDGVRDIAAVSFYAHPSSGSLIRDRLVAVYVDVFSGANGKRLYFMQSPQMSGFGSRVGSIPLIREYSHFGDMLLVDLDSRGYQSGECGRNVCFSLVDREVVFLGDEMARPKFADINGDSQTDLVAWRPNYRNRPTSGGDLLAFHIGRLDTSGRKTPSWQFADQVFQQIGDVNDDGVDDALRLYRDSTARHINMVSGDTGEYLWSCDVGSRSMRAFDIIAMQDDIDDDGAPDFIVAQNRTQKASTSPMEVRSGRTGKSIWQFQLPRAGSWRNPRVLDVSDIDGDDRQEMLFLAQSDLTPGRPAGGFDEPVQIYRVDAKTGKTKWTSELFPRDRYAQWLIRRFRFSICDANRDGVEDVVCYGLNENGGVGFRAVNGVDGSTIWQTLPSRFGQEITAREFSDYMPFEIITHPDRTELVTLRAKKKTLDIFCLDVATGDTRWAWSLQTGGGCWNGSQPNDTSAYGSTTPVRVLTRSGERLGLWHTNADMDVVFSLLNEKEDSAEIDSQLTLAKSRQFKEDRYWGGYLRSVTVHPIDLDSDGVDELVYATPDSLVAKTLSGETIWTVDVPDLVHRISSVHHRDDGGIEFIVASGKNYSQLNRMDAVDEHGRRLWTAELPAEDSLTSSVLHSSVETRTPRVMYTNLRGYTTCFDVQKTSVKSDDSTTFNANAAHPVFDRADPRLVKSPPWNVNASFVPDVLIAMTMSLTMLGLPLLYVSRLARGQWSLRTLLVAPVLVAIWLQASRLSIDLGGGPPWHPLFLNLLLAAYCFPAIVYLYVMTRLCLGRDWWRVGRLIALTLCIAVLMSLWMLWMTRYFSEAEPVQLRWTLSSFASMLFYGVGMTGAIIILVYLSKKLYSMTQWILVRNASPAPQ